MMMGRLAASYVSQRAPHLVLLAAMLCVALSGCGNDGAEGGKEDPSVTKTFEKGPVKMTVTVADSEITIADRIELTIEVVAD